MEGGCGGRLPAATTPSLFFIFTPLSVGAKDFFVPTGRGQEVGYHLLKRLHLAMNNCTGRAYPYAVNQGTT